MKMNQKPVKLTGANQSSEKLFTIIEYLAEQKEPVRLQDIAQSLEMNASTVLRFLATLTNCGYVAQDQETSRYYMTYKICSIANKVTSRRGLREIANPYIRALSNTLHEAVCLAIEQMSQVVYIDVIDGPDQMIRTMQRIGNSSPMHCTGVGKLFLTRLRPDQVYGYVQQMGLRQFTKNTITTVEGLLEELAEVRQLDYAFDNEECEIGAKCVAVPIRDYTGQIVAAISSTGPIYRFTDEWVDRYLPELKKTALAISRELGYTAED